MRNSVAHANTGEAMDLRKRAQDDDVPLLAHEAKGIGRRGDVFEVSLIKRDHNILRKRCDEFVDLGTLAVPASASKSERIELRLDLGGGMMLHLVRG